MAPIGMKLKICSVTTGIALTISAGVSQHSAVDSVVDSVMVLMEVASVMVVPQAVPQKATSYQIDIDTQINTVKTSNYIVLNSIYYYPH